MKIFNSLLLGALVLAGSAGASTVTMFNTGSIGSPGYFFFNIDNLPFALICDQFSPNVTTGPYTANVATLADLTGTVLFSQNDPNALQKYQLVAILVLLAFSDQSNIQLATDVTWANRRIVDGAGPLPGNAQTLYDFVLTQNPSAYDLTRFRIYTATPNRLLSQEMVGLDSPVPEPSTFVLLGAGLVGIAVRRYSSSAG